MDPRTSGKLRYEILQGTLLDRMGGDPVWRRPDGTLRVISSIEKEGWEPRQEDRREGFAHPGSCVSVHGQVYEVRAIVRDEDATGFSYKLFPWDAAFPIRQVFVHDEAHHSAEIERRSQARKEALLVYPALYLGHPLLGLLPSHLQSRLQDLYGVDAIRMTTSSALAVLALGGALVVSAVNHLEQGLGPSFALGLYLIAESLFRFRLAWGMGGPMGSIFTALPVILGEALVDALRHEQRRQRGDPRVMSARRQAKLVARLDLVQPTEGGGLLVRSYYPKKWSDEVTIGHEGRFYTLRSHSEEKTPDGLLFTYDLGPAAIEEVLRAVTPYRPDEGLRELEEREREMKADRLNMVGALLGLLPAAVQARWVPIGYMPMRAVRASCGIFGLGAALQLWYSLSVPAPNAAFTAIEVTGSTYLLIESAWRYYRVLFGEVTGSLLGLPLGLLLSRDEKARPQAS